MALEYTFYIAPLARLEDLSLPPTINTNTVKDELRTRGINVIELYVCIVTLASFWLILDPLSSRPSRNKLVSPTTSHKVRFTWMCYQIWHWTTLRDLDEKPFWMRWSRILLQTIFTFLPLVCPSSIRTGTECLWCLGTIASAVNDFAYYRTDTDRIETKSLEGAPSKTIKNIMPAATVYKVFCPSVYMLLVKDPCLANTGNRHWGGCPTCSREPSKAWRSLNKCYFFQYIPVWSSPSGYLLHSRGHRCAYITICQLCWALFSFTVYDDEEEDGSQVSDLPVLPKRQPFFVSHPVSGRSRKRTRTSKEEEEEGKKLPVLVFDTGSQRFYWSLILNLTKFCWCCPNLTSLRFLEYDSTGFSKSFIHLWQGLG